MEFEWDDAKSDACFVQRGFDFEYAGRRFSIPIGPSRGTGASPHLGTQGKQEGGP